MEMADPTEYYFAVEAFGSWDTWKAIQATQWIKNYLANWREELSNKLQSDALKRYASMALKGDVSAAKWFAERSWERQIPHLRDNAAPRRGKRGRPSDEERDAALKQAVASDKAELETLRRLGLLDGAG